LIASNLMLREVGNGVFPYIGPGGEDEPWESAPWRTFRWYDGQKHDSILDHA
jgi:hypothetical protein